MNRTEIILEHTRLAREYSELPNTADSEEEYAPMQKRKDEIKNRIAELKEMEKQWK